MRTLGHTRARSAGTNRVAVVGQMNSRRAVAVGMDRAWRGAGLVTHHARSAYQPERLGFSNRRRAVAKAPAMSSNGRSQGAPEDRGKNRPERSGLDPNFRNHLRVAPDLGDEIVTIGHARDFDGQPHGTPAQGSR